MVDGVAKDRSGHRFGLCQVQPVNYVKIYWTRIATPYFLELPVEWRVASCHKIQDNLTGNLTLSLFCALCDLSPGCEHDVRGPRAPLSTVFHIFGRLCVPVGFLPKPTPNLGRSEEQPWALHHLLLVGLRPLSVVVLLLARPRLLTRANASRRWPRIEQEDIRRPT